MIVKYRYWKENLESKTGIKHDSFDELSEKELYKQISFLINYLKLYNGYALANVIIIR